jgi:hypothetical protein
MNTTAIDYTNQWTFTQISTLVGVCATFIMQTFASFKQGHFDSKCFGHRLISIDVDSITRTEDKQIEKEAVKE